MYHQTATVVRAARGITKAGDVKLDWTHATRVDYLRVSLQPGATSEDINDGRDIALGQSTLYGRPGQDIDVTALDRIECEGDTYEVVGSPNRWPHPLRPGLHHVSVTLKEWSS